MIDSFDYKEPRCTLCGGKEFYNPQEDAPIDRIPVDRIIAKVDVCFNKNDFFEAGRILEFWKNEAISLNDKMGELSIESELIGFYRKTNRKEQALASIENALVLIEKLGQSEMASGATLFLNIATAYKAFGLAQKALPLYIKAENIYKKTIAKDDERFGGLYNNMALSLVDLNKLEEAKDYYFKAVSVMENIVDGGADLAITYVNLAHLYEIMGDKNNITDCLFKAYGLLNKDNLVKNGYYAYVCEKCAPSFENFGYHLIANELKKISEDIYART